MDEFNESGSAGAPLYAFNVEELYDYDLPNIRRPSEALTAASKPQLRSSRASIRQRTRLLDEPAIYLRRPIPRQMIEAPCGMRQEALASSGPAPLWSVT